MTTAFEFSIWYLPPQIFWLPKLVISIQRSTVRKMIVVICFRFSQQFFAGDGYLLGFYTMLQLSVSAFSTNQLQGDLTGSAGAEVVQRKKICWILQNYVVETSNMLSEIKKVTYYLRVLLDRNNSFFTSIPSLTWIKCITYHCPPPIGHNIFTSPTAWCPWKGHVLELWIHTGLEQSFHLFLLSASMIG